MEKDKRLTDEIYHRVPSSKDFNIKNFMIFYKEYINLPLFNKDKGLFLKNLNELDKSLGKIDVNKNILVMCDRDINKEVFLSLFSKKERLSSNRYMMAPQLYDIFWEKTTRENTRLEQDETFYSTQDIREDVLCLYICNEQYVHGVGPIINSVIESRFNRLNVRRENLYTWIFYRGNVNSIMSDKDYSQPYCLFKSKEDKNNYLIIDLNGKMSKVTDSKVLNNLEDIY